MEVILTKSIKRKSPSKWIKDTNCNGELALDYLQAKRGDKIVVKRFFRVQDKYFVNPFMATAEILSGEMMGKTVILNAFMITSLKKPLLTGA
jgi:hypothetical protein